MDRVYTPEAWRRLGDVLEARRGQLGYGFRQREQFLADRGGPPPSVKTLARLERGERTAYPPGTVTRLEALYGWAPGSFEAVLAGGDPVPLEGPAAPAQGSQPARGDDDPDDDDAALMFPGDTRHDRLIRNIWRHSEDLDQRLDLIEVVDPRLAAALRRLRDEGGQSEAGLSAALRLHVRSRMHGNNSGTLRVSGHHRTVLMRHD